MRRGEGERRVGSVQKVKQEGFAAITFFSYSNDLRFETHHGHKVFILSFQPILKSLQASAKTSISSHLGSSLIEDPAILQVFHFLKLFNSSLSISKSSTPRYIKPSLALSNNSFLSLVIHRPFHEQFLLLCLPPSLSHITSNKT